MRLKNCSAARTLHLTHNKRVLNMSHFHTLSMQSITGETVDFSTFENTVCLVVNVASR